MSRMSWVRSMTLRSLSLAIADVCAGVSSRSKTSTSAPTCIARTITSSIYVEDELGSVDDLEVALFGDRRRLRRRQLAIEDEHVGADLHRPDDHVFELCRG